LIRLGKLDFTRKSAGGRAGRPAGLTLKRRGWCESPERQEKIDTYRIPIGLVGVMFGTLKERGTWQSPRNTD
jgi:hypothetical protein